MNILFIYTDTIESNTYKKSKKFPLHTQYEINFGISYMISILKDNGFKVKLFIISNKTSKKDLNNEIKNFIPKLICFTAVYREYKIIKNISKFIKNNYPSIYNIAGGPQVTLNPEIAIKDSFDAICIGEGEYPILELAKQLKNNKKPSNIKNLWIKNANDIEKNNTRAFISDLDELPFLDRKIWQPWIKEKNTPQTIVIGRGCPFDCSYCCNHILKKISNGNYVRYRRPENIISEIKQVLKDFPNTKAIYFEVEAININLEYLSNLCNKLYEFNKKINHNLIYGANFRIIPSQNITMILETLKQGNILYLNIGLESGNERIRSEIMKRNYSNTDVKRTIKTAKSLNINIMLYVMIGLPTETINDFKETINLVREFKPDSLQLNIFFPYPGTDIYKYSLKNNFISKDINDMGRHVATIDWPNFSKKQIQEHYNNFVPNIYRSSLFYNVLLIMCAYLIQNYRFYSLYKIQNFIIRKILKKESLTLY